MEGAQGEPVRHLLTPEDGEIMVRNLRRIGRWSIAVKGDSLRALARACGDYLHYGPDERPSPLPEIMP